MVMQLLDEVLKRDSLSGPQFKLYASLGQIYILYLVPQITRVSFLEPCPNSQRGVARMGDEVVILDRLAVSITIKSARLLSLPYIGLLALLESIA